MYVCLSNVGESERMNEIQLAAECMRIAIGSDKAHEKLNLIERHKTKIGK